MLPLQIIRRFLCRELTKYRELPRSLRKSTDPINCGSDDNSEFPELFDPKKKGCAFIRWLPNNKSPTRAGFWANFRKIARPEIERNSSHHDSNQLRDYPCGLTSP